MLKCRCLALRWSLLVCGVLGGLWVRPDRAQASEPPRLVIVLVIDQLRQEYFHRFRENLSEDGLFLQMLSQGAHYRNCHHGSAFTFTGPGHAVLLTGAFPRHSGIIGNAWYDRGLGRSINCVADDDATVIGTADTAAGASPRNLLAPTVGDQLKLATAGAAKVFAIGFKDRAAISTGGHLCDAAFWLDGSSGNWVTSSVYREDLPGYLRNLNEGHASAVFAGREWTLLYDAGKYHVSRPDDSPFENPGDGLSRQFPHTLPAADDSSYFRQLRATPFGNEYTLMTAWEILEQENLGADAVPDILVINLACNDYTGHHFGPYSLEVEDMFYRTDRILGEFLQRLRSQLGDRWTMLLTADHGVAPIPEYAADLGLKSVRDPLGTEDQLQQQLEAALRLWLELPADVEPSLVLEVESNQVYLNDTHPQLQDGRFGEAQRRVRDFLLRDESVALAVTREQLLAGLSTTRLNQMLERAFHPQRCGDVLFVTRPYQFYPGRYCTSHGSPWSYDTHVPLMLLGSGIRPGAFDRRVHPGDLAATISRLLAITPPASCTHDALEEALAVADPGSKADPRASAQAK